MTGARQDVLDQPVANGELIEVRIGELRQLFNSIDASPFGRRHLDPGAEEFIVGWAREAPRAAQLELRVNVSQPVPTEASVVRTQSADLRSAIHASFADRARSARRQLRQLLGTGRASLLVGLAFLVVAVGLGGFVAHAVKDQRLGDLLREGLVICGWVAMWRPLETLLYDWWPLRANARLFDRLSVMPVRIWYCAAPASKEALQPRSETQATTFLLRERHKWPRHHEQTIREAGESWRNEGNPN